MSEEKKEEKKFTELAHKQFDDICDALDNIHANTITVLTGNNATGKSLVRKLIWSYISKELDKEIKCADTSMERRTGLHSELGGCGVFCRDNDVDATSQNSLYFIKGILNATDRYIIIDEPEIGMSESLQKSVAVYLNQKFPEVLEKNYGILVITHSKQIVKTLENATFVNLQHKSKEEWLNSEPEIIDLDVFEQQGTDLFRLINSKMKWVKS